MLATERAHHEQGNVASVLLLENRLIRGAFSADRLDRADVFVQHARLAANEATPFHTHPGPAIVTVVRGALTYEDAKGRHCRRTTYVAGKGFMDRGFGHVHRAVAGPQGADFYVTYILPSGSATHLTVRPAPRACQ